MPACMFSNIDAFADYTIIHCENVVGYALLPVRYQFYELCLFIRC